MIIKEITETSVQVHSEINTLLSQLTNRPSPLSIDDFSEIVNSKNSILLGAFVDNNLVGILTLVVYNIPTGKNGRIEDVVVNEKFRNKKIGKTLSLRAMELAKELNVKKLFLTSNPKRIAANQLYLNIGFKLGETNSYFYNIEK